MAIQRELQALIPQGHWAPDRLPEPGENSRTSMPCGDKETYQYPVGSTVRLTEDVDPAPLIDKLTAHLRSAGWDEVQIPTDDRPGRTMQISPNGYESIISSLDRPDDLPMLTITLWSPCATLPEGVNPYSFKI